jgi:hypothetical protein
MHQFQTSTNLSILLLANLSSLTVTYDNALCAGHMLTEGHGVNDSAIKRRYTFASSTTVI